MDSWERLLAEFSSVVDRKVSNDKEIARLERMSYKAWRRECIEERLNDPDDIAVGYWED